MKVVILCGGLGTRLSVETQIRPTPMMTVGGQRRAVDDVVSVSAHV